MFSKLKRRYWHPGTYVLSIVMLMVFALPLAVGGVHGWTICLVGAFSAMALLFGALDASRRKGHLHLDGFALVLLAVVLWTFLQCLPLPLFLLKVLSPLTAENYQNTAAFLGVEQGAFPLSLHRVQTQLDAVRLLSVFICFVLVVNLVRQRLVLGEHLLETVALSGLLVLVIGAAQTLLGTGILFGAYEPGGIGLDRLFVGTFVNENHLAGLFNLAGLTALGVSHSAERQRKKLLFAAIFAGCMLGTVLTLSRGGIVAALVSCVLYAVFISRAQRPYKRKSNHAFGIVVILFLITVSAAVAYDLLKIELGSLMGLGTTTPDLKFESWGRVVDVVRDFPLMGVGSGAFGDVFAGYNDLRPGVEFSHVENFPLQMVVDYGIPFAVLVLGAGLFFLMPVVKSALRDEDSIGAIAGLYAVVVQNFVDFSLGILGVVIPTVVVLAVLVGRRLNASEGPKSRSWTPPLWAMWPVAFGCVVVTVFVGGSQEKYGDEAIDREMLARVQAVSTSGKKGAVDSEDPWVNEVALRRPMDSHFFLEQAIYHSVLGNVDESVRWVEASIERNPKSMGARLVLARSLLKQGETEEAAVIYRSLLADYWEKRASIFAAIALGSQSAAFFEKTLPVEAQLVEQAVLWLKSQRRKGWAYTVLSIRVEAQPEDYEFRYQLGLLLTGTPSLEVEASREATQLMARHSDRSGGYLLQGHLYEREKEYPKALAMFVESVRMNSSDTDAALGKARVLAKMGKHDEMREVVGALRPRLSGNNDKLSRMHVILSIASEGEGRLKEAILSMEMATRLRHNHVPSLLRLGTLHLEVSDRTNARSAFEQILVLDPGNVSAKEALENMDPSDATR